MPLVSLLGLIAGDLFVRPPEKTLTRGRFPQLKNMDDVTRLGRFLCVKPLPRELSTAEQSLDGQWIQSLVAAMIEVLDKRAVASNRRAWAES